MKIYLTALSFLFVVPVLAFAAYTDVTLSESTVLSVSGYSLVVSGTNNVDSITVSGDNFSVVLSQNAAITVTSADKRSFTVSPEQYLRSFSCDSNSSSLEIGNNSVDSAVTVTITPSSSACSVLGGGIVGGSSGGGGGGGGGGSVSTPTATTPAASVAQPSPVAQVVSPVFNATLKYGMTSDDVSRLQQLLASDSDIYPEGIVSGWFGQLTKKAVEKFQTKYGIDPVGIVGPQTRAKLAEVFGTSAITQSSAPSSQVTTPSSVSAIFTIGLKKGMSNNDIKRLQQLLNSDPDTKIAESGTGSSGSETEYFGSLTEIAVKKFQKKYGLASEGDAGYGYVGPKTRAKLMEVFK